MRSDSHLAGNLAAFRSRWGYAPEVAAGSDDVRLGPPAAIRARDGRWLAVHNPADPAAEARHWLRTSLTGGPPPPLACIVGAGLGHIVDVIADQQPATKMLVVEPEPVLAHAMLSRRDWTALIEAGRLMVLVGPGYRGQHEAWRMFTPGAAPVRLLHPVICGTRVDEAREAARLLARAQQGAAANDEARHRFAGTYVLNTSRNIPAIATERDVAALFGTRQGLPIVVASAGPSLDRNIDELRPYRDRVTLVAVDTTLKPLVDAGMPPDIIVAVDPSELNARHLLEAPECASTVLVAEGSIAPAVIDRFRGRTFFYRVARHDPWPWIESVGLDVGLLRAWGSVTTTAFDLAVKLGGDPIVFIGTDLAYTAGRPYCRGIVFEREWSAQPRPIEEVWTEIVNGPLTSAAIDMNGNRVRTTPTMVACREWLVEQVALTSSRRIVNATGAGLLTIEPRIPLARALEGCRPRALADPLASARRQSGRTFGGTETERIDAHLLVPFQPNEDPVLTRAHRLIPAGVRVLDLSAGDDARRQAIENGCPADGDFDVVVAVNVIEYLHDIEAVLRRAAAAAPAAVISYCAQPDRSASGERFGYRNALTFVDLIDTLHRAGWQIARAEVLPHEAPVTQWLLALRQVSETSPEAA